MMAMSMGMRAMITTRMSMGMRTMITMRMWQWRKR